MITAAMMQFRERVFADPKLAETLQKYTDVASLNAACIVQAREIGIEINAAELQTLITANRCAWIERWI
jgi:hypothetical protein